MIYPAFSVYTAALPIHAVVDVGCTATKLARLYVTLALAATEKFVLPKLARKLPAPVIAAGGCSLLIVAYLLFSPSSEAALIAGAVFYGVGNGLMWPSFLMMLSRSGPAEYQGSVPGVGRGIGSLASIIGTVTGGVLHATIGVATFYISAAAITVATCMFVLAPGARECRWHRCDTLSHASRLTRVRGVHHRPCRSHHLEVYMSEKERVSNVILGGGESGKYLAWELAQQGHPVVVIERALIGGSCPNIACLPSKNIIRSAKVADFARHGAEYGVHAQALTEQMEGVRARKRAMVAAEIEAHRARFAMPQLTFLLAEGRLVGPRTVEARLAEGGTRCFVADRLLLDLGTRAAIPDVPGLATRRR